MSGRDLMLAMTAGAEVMIRIGLAAKGSLEPRGFHAPGTTGPFGGAVTVRKADAARPDEDDLRARHRGLAVERPARIRAFQETAAWSRSCISVARRNRACWRRALPPTASTARRTVIEGEAGYLEAFGTEHDFNELTKGLGRDYVSMYIMMKRFACHVTAHRPGRRHSRSHQRAQVHAGGRRDDHAHRQRAHGVGEQHPRAARRAACAVQHSVLGGARVLPQSDRSQFLRRERAHGPQHPRHGGEGEDERRARTEARGSRRRPWP